MLDKDTKKGALQVESEEDSVRPPARNLNGSQDHSTTAWLMAIEKRLGKIEQGIPTKLEKRILYAVVTLFIAKTLGIPTEQVKEALGAILGG